jgi:hypothetical protein
LRDPHFAETEEGGLELFAGKTILEGGRYTERASIRLVRNATTWGDPETICAKGDWLWRASYSGKTLGE